jgi:SLT domain-containing protein
MINNNMSQRASVSSERKNILNFIRNISQKNYAEANKYLQEVIDSKLKDRIQKASNKEIF